VLLAVILITQECLAFLLSKSPLPPWSRSLPFVTRLHAAPPTFQNKAAKGDGARVEEPLRSAAQVVAEAHEQLKDAFAEVDVRTQARLKKILQIYRKHQVSNAIIMPSLL